MWTGGLSIQDWCSSIVFVLGFPQTLAFVRPQRIAVSWRTPQVTETANGARWMVYSVKWVQWWYRCEDAEGESMREDTTGAASKPDGRSVAGYRFSFWAFASNFLLPQKGKISEHSLVEFRHQRFHRTFIFLRNANIRNIVMESLSFGWNLWLWLNKPPT